jgi:AmmeMemoRadiSam system protein B
MQTLQKQTPRIAPELIDYRNSGATSGDMTRVVGYAGVVIE